MNKHLYQNLKGTDGLFTYHFFCEAILGNLHSLMHSMEHSEIAPPDSLGGLPQHLSQIGMDLMDDYKEEKLDFDRLKTQLDDLFEFFYVVDEDLEPLMDDGNDEMKYYYFLLHQGLRLVFPNILENCVADLPDDADFAELTKFLQIAPQDSCDCGHDHE